jgi:TolA-binding protein
MGGCGRSPTRVRTDLPPADQMTLGARAVQNGNFYEALALLKGYVEREPSGEKADEAHYLMGVSYFRTKEWPSAATEFVIVINQFADSPHVPSRAARPSTRTTRSGRSPSSAPS